jgi:hypothetical protein
MSRLLVALGVLTAVVLGCGDGIVIIAFNSGTIVSDPSCGGGGGQFELVNQGGLMLLVIISSDTVIFNADGHTGYCGDLSKGNHVQVRGPQSGGRIDAQSVTVE